eukprot:912234-Pleurochrysis_carterae.AAC.1
MTLHVLLYLPTPTCSRRAYVRARSEPGTKLSRDSTTGRFWTDGRPNCLRGKTVVTLLNATFT